jgi:hypothetical protein
VVLQIMGQNAPSAPYEDRYAMSIAGDNRLVVLLKSRSTNNRFYTLVTPDSGMRNADAIDSFPDHLPLGIAYPCLEDGLNDFAVIRTTFETLDLFPDDQALREEMMEIISDARGNLRKRLAELRDKIACGQAHFLGTDLAEFKQYLMHLATKGTPRRTLDNMMKVDVFESVAEADAASNGMPEPMYCYEPVPLYALERIEVMPARDFVASIFDDVLESVEDPLNYQTKYDFDKYVFQKFISVMFVNYATTDPMFYGTNKEDYGVALDKEMQDTPLYRAVGQALRHLEREFIGAPQLLVGEPDLEPAANSHRTIELPNFPATEQMLVGSFAFIAEAVRVLNRVQHPQASEAAQLIGRASSELFGQLRELGVISPVALNPVDNVTDPPA